jgi:hypothetical protein
MEPERPPQANQHVPAHWIVICPEPSIRGGLWARWYRENCVAVGWSPPSFYLEGEAADLGWAFARTRLKQVRPGDKVIPFLLKWRIGPVGTVKDVKAADADWSATVQAGHAPWGEDEDLGRRILVSWEQDGMPPGGKVAIVPPNHRTGGGPLARHTIEQLNTEQYQNLCSVLSDPKNWLDLTSKEEQSDGEIDEASLPQPHPPDLSLLERDLQKFVSRNLDVIERGLKADPGFQLEEYIIDVGRIDLLCKDAEGNWVVIELKADWAGDDAVGQILGYMNWVKENLPNGSTVRGIIVCKNTTGRVKAAIKWVPRLSVRRFNLSFKIEEMS